MKLVRLLTCLLGSRSGFNPNFYCTKALPRRRDTSNTELFRRISPVGDPNISMIPILDQWIKEGRFVDKQSIIDIMHKLLRFNRFRHALEVSMWMTDKRYFELTYSDASFRLYLISKFKGIDETERYFNNLSQKLKCPAVYGALLNCYANAQCVEKAEAVMQQIRNLGGNHPRDYAVMLNLYRKTGNMEKFDALLQEMEQKGIDRSRDALETQLSAYSDVNDIERMDKIVRVLESDPNVTPNWTTYSGAAAAYTKAGLFDKALQMLKKAEACVSFTDKGYDAYDSLLTQYGTIGRKDEVLRVWSLYKHKYRVYNNGYKCVLRTLVKLGDFEMAEEIFQEWESQGLSYDMRVPNILISAYCRRGLMGKAEAVLNSAMAKGGNQFAWTLYFMCEGYLLSGQYEKAVEMMKRVTADSEIRRKPVPTVASIKACLEYLKGIGDTQQSEEFAKLLEDRDANSLDQQEEWSVEEEGDKLL